ncbi:MAG: DNA translocase FtsK 4TM domain-containing protein, partial [Anaerolineales bacterium]|nr:DNA translocase FtsK 4TM domain-containing protein [Anaerolineales bacterium]
KTTTTRKANGRSSSSRRQTEARSKTRGGTSKGSSTSRSSGRKTAVRRPGFTLNVQQKALIFGIGIILLTFVLVLSLLSPNQGQLTAGLSTLMWRLFGWGGFVMPIITAIIGLYLVLWGMDQPPGPPGHRVFGFAILFLVFEGFASLSSLSADNGLMTVWEVARAGTGGGYIGGLVSAVLTEFVGWIGTVLVLVVTGIIGAVLATGISRQELARLLGGVWVSLRSSLQQRPEPAEPVSRPPIRVNPGRGRTAGTTTQLPLLPNAEPEKPPTPQKTAVSPPPPVRELPIGQPKRATQPAKPANPAPAAAEPSFLGNARSENSDTPGWAVPAVAEMLDPGSDPAVNNATIQRQVEIIEHTLASFGAPATTVEINQGPTVTQFGIEPNYLEMRNGKRTRVKVSKIASLSDDLALALAAESIRIEAPVPGKGYIGIEVPNPAKATVSLRDVMESSGFQKLKSSLRIGLGHNVSGQAISADLSAMPHLLVAGTTGSGKSVCVNGIIACLLLQNTPDDLKLVMVDPKRVELTGYNGIPHLAAPVVVEMDRVIGTLQWALREMDGRYKLFAEVGARNIKDYNQKTKRVKGKDKLPYVVIIIDELADLMMMAPEDTERSIARLAQMARATGIHMVIATQRPSVDVVTGLIKANFPARIAFAVASSTDSRVILDSTGAERLLGQGDMLFQSPDAGQPVRLQGCYVSDGELNRIIHYWQTARRFATIRAEEQIIRKPEDLAQKMAARRAEQAAAEPKPTAAPPTPKAEQPKPAAKPAAPKPTPPKSADVPRPQSNLPPLEVGGVSSAGLQKPLWEALDELNNDPEAEAEDELLPEAVALVRKLNKASTSLLQRRFRIGYTRAARLVDYMEQQGIIGPPTGTSKAREVIGDSPQSDEEEDADADEEMDDAN